MNKGTEATNWDPSFDDAPTTDVPRIRFSQKFSTKYLEGKNFILEIGCGTGSFTKLIDRSGYFGLDLSIDAIKVAKKYCVNSQFVVASALNLPFREEIFDMLCIWGVFEELPAGTERIILLESKRTLKSKSTLLLSTYNDHLISKILDPAHVFRGVRHYNLKKFIHLLSESGFLINEYTVRGGLNTAIAIFLFYFYKHILKKKNDLIKNFFDRKSADEINAGDKGLVYIYMATHKIL
jgi:ubiquinone/menaquinone biosynthesis C-methylase UbiE